MEVKQVFNDEDKRKLYHMLSFGYKVPYELPVSRNVRHKIIYIGSGMLYLLSILFILLKIYYILPLTLGVPIISTIWAIYYQKKGKNLEATIYTYVYQDLEKIKHVYFDESKIIYAKQEFKYSEIQYALFYDDFCFIISNKRPFTIKLNLESKNHLKEILSNYNSIHIEEKNQPFNLYSYLTEKWTFIK